MIFQTAIEAHFEESYPKAIRDMFGFKSGLLVI
jgi:hypothetical protein